MPFWPTYPHHHALSRLFTRTLLCYVTFNINMPPCLPNKKRNFFYKHWLALGKAVIFTCQHHLKTPFFKSMYKSISSTFEYKSEHLNRIRTFEYNSKFKYKHWNLRLKHYLYYKVRREGTNKSYKICYFGLRIPYMQSFL